MTDPFFEVIEPYRDRLRALAEETQRLGAEGGRLPAAHSRAMAELAVEGEYRGEWGDEPVRSCHVAGLAALHGAADHTVAVCRLFESDPVPMYAHWTLVRGAVEHAGWAHHLAMPDIGVKLRVARGRNERLYSLDQASKLPSDMRPPNAKARRRQIYETARTLGLDRCGDWIVERRPGFREVVVALYATVGEAEHGAAVYNFTSANAHATQYGLIAAVGSVVTDAFRGPMAQLRVTADGVIGAFRMVAFGLQVATTAVRKLHGWDMEDGWKTAARAFSVLGADDALG